MKNSRHSFLKAFALASLCLCGVVNAKTTVLSDTGTWVEKPSIAMEWESKVPGRSNQVGTALWIKARVDTTPVVGKTGQLTMRLRNPPVYPLLWGIDSSALPSQSTSTQAMIMWQGKVAEKSWQNEWRLWFKADGRWFNNTESFQFQFEFEETP